MRFVRLVAAAFPVLLAACLGSTTDIEPAPAEVPIEQTTFATSLGVNLASFTKTADGIYYRDVTPGTGATVASGQTLGVYYTGALSSGATFDARVSGTPLSFIIGAHQVIEGWDRGLIGMKVGGTRQLIIPQAFGYGPTGYGPIPGNAVLVFSVNVISAQ